MVKYHISLPCYFRLFWDNSQKTFTMIPVSSRLPANSTAFFKTPWNLQVHQRIGATKSRDTALFKAGSRGACVAVCHKRGISSADSRKEPTNIPCFDARFVVDFSSVFQCPRCQRYLQVSPGTLAHVALGQKFRVANHQA